MAKKKTTSKKKAGDVALSGEERVVVLCGDEVYGQEQKLKELRAAVEKASGEEPSVMRFEGKTAVLVDVLDELRSFSLMGGRKVVVVDGADAFITRYREQLERYAEDAADIAVLVLRAGTWNATWRVHKAIVKVGAVVKCERMGAAEAARWIGMHVSERYGVKLEVRAASLLVEHLGSDMGLLAAEAGKLAAGTPAGESITADRVEQMVGIASDEKAWEVQGALLSGSAGEAVGKVSELIDLAGVPEQVVGHFVADLVRKLHRAALMLGRGEPEFEVCKEMKVWGERQRAFVSAVKRLGSSGAGRLLGEYVELDGRGKSGFGRSRENLERFCVSFAVAVGRG